jgi:hypothetical protein
MKSNYTDPSLYLYSNDISAEIEPGTDQSAARLDHWLGNRGIKVRSPDRAEICLLLTPSRLAARLSQPFLFNFLGGTASGK